MFRFVQQVSSGHDNLPKGLWSFEASMTQIFPLYAQHILESFSWLSNISASTVRVGVRPDLNFFRRRSRGYISATVNGQYSGNVEYADAFLACWRAGLIQILDCAWPPAHTLWLRPFSVVFRYADWLVQTCRQAGDAARPSGGRGDDADCDQATVEAAQGRRRIEDRTLRAREETERFQQVDEMSGSYRSRRDGGDREEPRGRSRVWLPRARREQRRREWTSCYYCTDQSQISVRYARCFSFSMFVFSMMVKRFTCV